MRALHLEEGPWVEPPEVACPYCHGAAVFFPSSEPIYGTDYGPLWVCSPCNAWVGVHKGTRTPKGSLADQRTRTLRKDAHKYFDHMWIRRLARDWPRHKPKQRYIKRARGAAYGWLQGQMGLDPDACHIGSFGPPECERVIDLCRPFYRPDLLKDCRWVRRLVK